MIEFQDCISASLWILLELFLTLNKGNNVKVFLCSHRQVVYVYPGYLEANRLRKSSCIPSGSQNSHV